jgi:hypothetical protein
MRLQRWGAERSREAEEDAEEEAEEEAEAEACAAAARRRSRRVPEDARQTDSDADRDAGRPTRSDSIRRAAQGPFQGPDGERWLDAHNSRTKRDTKERRSLLPLPSKEARAGRAGGSARGRRDAETRTVNIKIRIASIKLSPLIGRSSVDQIRHDGSPSGTSSTLDAAEMQLARKAYGMQTISETTNAASPPRVDSARLAGADSIDVGDCGLQMAFDGAGASCKPHIKTPTPDTQTHTTIIFRECRS